MAVTRAIRRSNWVSWGAVSAGLLVGLVAFLLLDSESVSETGTGTSVEQKARSSTPEADMLREMGSTPGYTGRAAIGEERVRELVVGEDFRELIGMLLTCDAQASPADQLTCLREFLQRAGGDADRVLAELVCGSRLTNSPALIASYVSLNQSGDMFDCLEAVYSFCPSFIASDQMEGAVHVLLERRPDLLVGMEDSLSPSRVFDPENSELYAKLIAELMLDVESDWAKSILVEGAAGAYGGSPLQIDTSLLSVVRALGEEETVALCSQVLWSDQLPSGVQDVAMGSSLVSVLTMESILGSTFAPEALSLLDLLLDHPLLGPSAAAHVVGQLMEPPPEAAEFDWKFIRAHAQAVLDAYLAH